MTEDIINKQEVIVDNMKKNKLISVFNSAVGGALIAVSLLFLLALLIGGIKNNILTSVIVFCVTIIFGFLLIWTAYKT